MDQPFGRVADAQAYVVVDLGFGDAGKGSVVDFLTRETNAHTVIRFNGGAQAGHRVLLSDGREHVFSQFGAGTLAGADTFLSQHMLVDPAALLVEAEALTRVAGYDILDRLTVDARALVVTPFHRAVNRLRELARGAARHGSCGMGIGETMADALALGRDALQAGDFQSDGAARKMRACRDHNLSKARALTLPSPDSDAGRAAARELAVLTDPEWMEIALADGRALVDRVRCADPGYVTALLRRPGTIIFEGAQGVLLDEWHGFHPHTTWSTTTTANADRMLAQATYAGQVTRLGVTRCYTPRHGAGPLVTEDHALTQALPDARNGWDAWQAGFRVGWLDLVLLRYAVDVAGPLDGVALTCLDRAEALPQLALCAAYREGEQTLFRLTPATRRSLAYQARLTALLGRCRPILRSVPDVATLVRTVSNDLDVPVLLTSWGPTAEDKVWQSG